MALARSNILIKLRKLPQDIETSIITIETSLHPWNFLGVSLNVYGKTFQSIQKAFSFVKFSIIGQEDYIVKLLPIQDYNQFVESQKLLTFLERATGISVPNQRFAVEPILLGKKSLSKKFVKNFYKRHGELWTKAFKLELMRFLIEKLYSIDQNPAIFLNLKIQNPNTNLFFIPEKVNNFWGFDPDNPRSGQNNYGKLLEQYRNEISGLYSQNGFNSVAKQISRVYIRDKIQFPFIKSNNQMTDDDKDINNGQLEADDEQIERLPFASEFIAAGEFKLRVKLFYKFKKALGGPPSLINKVKEEILFFENESDNDSQLDQHSVADVYKRINDFYIDALEEIDIERDRFNKGLSIDSELVLKEKTCLKKTKECNMFNKMIGAKTVDSILSQFSENRNKMNIIVTSEKKSEFKLKLDNENLKKYISSNDEELIDPLLKMLLTDQDRTVAIDPNDDIEIWTCVFTKFI